MAQQVLERVVAKLGGPEQTAAQLGITTSLLQRFLDGSLQVPDQVLLKAVDLVTESSRVNKGGSTGFTP